MSSSDWRFIGFEERNGFRNMALDEAVFQGLLNGFSRPTVRLYGWSPSCASIGAFQKMSNEVDEEACEEDGVDILRRKTGGGAVFHDTKGEITYSVVAREEDFNGSSGFEDICSPVIEFLNSIGISAKFEPVNDIHVSEKKISGNARTSDLGVVLQHGTILFDVNPDEMFTYLKPEISKVSDKHVNSVKKRVTSISREKDISKEECVEGLSSSFRDANFISSIEEGSFTEKELEVADEIEERHRSDDWKFKRG